MDQVPDLRGGNRETAKWVVVPVSLAVFVGGLVWNAARYPTREEFNAQAKQIVELQMKMVEVKTSTDSTKEAVFRMEKSQADQFLRMETAAARERRRR